MGGAAVTASAEQPCTNGDPNCTSFAGPVGVGTAAPAAKLDVFDGFLQIPRPSGSVSSDGAWFKQENVANNRGLWALASRNAVHFAFYNSGGNRDVLNLTPEGNVGIGTNSPGQALELVRDNLDVGLRFTDPGDGWFTIGMAIFLADRPCGIPVQACPAVGTG